MSQTCTITSQKSYVITEVFEHIKRPMTVTNFPVIMLEKWIFVYILYTGIYIYISKKSIIFFLTDLESRDGKKVKKNLLSFGNNWTGNEVAFLKSENFIHKKYIACKLPKCRHVFWSNFLLFSRGIKLSRLTILSRFRGNKLSRLPIFCEFHGRNFCGF